jgi:uncharacterized protein
MKQLGIIKTICRYPVKSMAGEEVESGFVGFSGLLGDRAYAFIREDGPKGFPWLTAREYEDLLLFRPKYRRPEEVTSPVDLQASIDMAPGVNPVFPQRSAFEVDVTTPEGEVIPLVSDTMKAHLEKQLGVRVSLRFSERSLYDCRPISIFGNATVRGLSDELGAFVDQRRFRANLYVDWNEDLAFRENDFVGRTLQIGERARVAVVERDPRCKVITIDPDTAETTPRLLRHLAMAHEGMAGVYAAVLMEGSVRRGDSIRLG